LPEPLHIREAVRFAPGERHWLGATATTAVTYIALQDELDGRTVDWAEQVTDE
jgi:quercetin dioxygenase-like cupin family protein